MNETDEHPHAWKDRAACKGRTDLFFLNRGDTSRMKRAKAICSSCPVIDQCREYVIYNPERYGIWAGMTEKDRRAYRLEQGIKLPNAPHGTPRRYAVGCRCPDCHTFRRR